MLDRNARIVGQALLEQFPEFLQLALVEDAEFRGQMGVTLGQTLSLEDGAAVFERAAFLDGVARRHEDPHQEVSVPDITGVDWRLETSENAERTILTLSSGDRTFRLVDVPGLKPTAVGRLADFDRALRLAGLAPADLADWRARLAERKLDAEEVSQLEQSLANTPAAVADAIGVALRSTANLDSLVPSGLEYWDRLCGSFGAEGLPMLATLTSGYAAELIGSRGVDGARQALWLAGEGKLLLDAGVGDLPADALLALAEGLDASGDLLSKVAFVEVALGAVERVPELVAPIATFVEEVVALEPASRGGPLWLLSSLIVMVDGQLSHLKLHPDWAPLRRRQAAIAHASLIARQWPPEVDPEKFVSWAMDARSAEFYFQTLVDLWREPRWSYEHVAPEQLKNEFVSRLHNAGARHAELIKETPLEALFQGRGEGSLFSQMRFPGTFLPGPLEGAQPAEPLQPPPEVEEVIEENLAVERLRAGALASLLNIRGLFSVGDDKITRLMTLIEGAGFRLPDDAKPEGTDVLLGLAGLSAVTRTPALADQVRIMVRRRRVDGQAMSLYGELGLALTCAAARSDRRAWAEAFGEWVAELAFSTTNRGRAIELRDHLTRICLISPYLRASVGRSMAALQSFLGM